MIRPVWPLAAALLVAPCAAQPADSFDAMIGRGELASAEALARAGGDSTLSWLGEILVLRGRVAEARPLLEQAAAGRYGTRRATAVLAELAERRGDPVAVRLLAQPLADAWRRDHSGWSADDLIAAGRVLRLLGQDDPDAVRDALEAFDAASAADPTAVEGTLRAADLFLERYNAPDAVQGYRDVLARHDDDVRAMVGLAHAATLTGGNPLTLVRQGLAIDPQSVPALLLLARLHLEAEQYDSSRVAATRALAADSTSLGAWAAVASLAWLADDGEGFAEAERQVGALSARPAGFYAAVAEAAGRHRRYAAAAELARRGVALDGGSVAALGALGTNLLRTGRIAEGRAALERAFARDPFHLWHKNTLDLLDELATFETIRTARFEFVAPPEDAALLAAVIGPLLEAGYDRFAARYDYRPPTPIRIEFYDRHADFSVRTIGLAGLGALGVSFGTVLAMDAPDARPAGEFNVGSTAWHELAHTFTLGASANRVPRWFSEGLSVLEERRARPGWGAHASIGFVAALASDSLLPMARLNDGFVRPDRPDRLGLSYYQASLVVEFLEREVGIEGIRSMLRGYAAGDDTETVVVRVTGGTMEVFDVSFFGWLRERFATPLAAIASGDATVFGAPLSAGIAALQAGDSAAAVVMLTAARERFPEYGGSDGPALPLAMTLWSTGEPQAALEALTGVTERDETALTANEVETTWRMARGDTLGALAALERATWIAPYGIEMWRRRAEVAGALGQGAEVVLARRAIVLLRPADPVAARTDLAEALLDAGHVADARRELLGVLEQASGYERAQGLLLKARRAGTTP
jgi:tetratricopeptide (TPR) repeat protein